MVWLKTSKSVSETFFFFSVHFLHYSNLQFWTTLPQLHSADGPLITALAIITA